MPCRLARERAAKRVRRQRSKTRRPGQKAADSASSASRTPETPTSFAPCWVYYSSFGQYLRIGHVAGRSLVAHPKIRIAAKRTRTDVLEGEFGVVFELGFGCARQQDFVRLSRVFAEFTGIVDFPTPHVLIADA